MLIRNADKWHGLSPVSRYLLSAATVLAVLGINLWMLPLLAQYYPYALFRIASLFVAFFWGVGPATFALVFGVIAGNFFLIEPVMEFTLPGEKDLMDFSLLIIGTFSIILLIEYLQRLRMNSDLLRRVAESRYEMLLHRENQRLMRSGKTGD